MLGRRGKKRTHITVGYKIICDANFILRNQGKHKEPNNAILLEKRKQATEHLQKF